MFFYLSLIETDEERSKFEEIYYEYKDLMYYVAFDILKDNVGAEDAVHDAFLKIINILEKIDDVKCPKTKSLIVIIVKRTAIDEYRSRKRKQTLRLDDDALTLSTEAELDKLEIGTSIQKAILKLPDKYRDVLMLKYDNELSDVEISALTGMSVSNVRKTVYRAKQRLGEILKEMDL